MSPDTALILGALADLREEVQIAVRRMLARQDRIDLVRLAPLVHAVFGDHVWTAAQLYAHALAAPEGDELRTEIEAWEAQGDAGGLRALGNMLERCRDVVSGGLRLVHVGQDRPGALYSLKRVSRPSKHAAVLAQNSAAADD